jgi:thiamine biosynthesis lipoprotein
LLIQSQGKKRLPLVFFSLLVIVNCRAQKWNTSTLFFFDTICDLQLRCSPSQTETALKETNRLFLEIEAEFSPGRPVTLSPLQLELWQKSLRIYHDSNGSFDVTVGPLTELWGFRSKDYRLPPPEELEVALRVVGMKKITQMPGTFVIQPGMKLDWGGIAKGWGVDRAAEALQKKGVRRGFINAGGDLYCWGSNPEGKEWKIGIKHPRQTGFLGVLTISNLGVATSGDYQRYFESGGIRYHHIFDPKTGFPAQGKQSVTVIGPETVYCDALSTALFVSPQPEVILKKYPGYGAVVVESNGKVAVLGKAFSLELFPS